ncbi:MAG: phytoene/squalene synthase family protein [Anaerolineae bacterium]|nr:phytoene/squalene synthase family protein [Anaerolineae bacterium]
MCVEISPEMLVDSYEACHKVIQEHSKTFEIASALLPGAKRRAAHALYAFSRISDDLVDRTDGEPLLALQDWRERSLYGCQNSDDLVVVAWSDAQARFGIPRVYAEQLLDGVSRDITKKRYETFDQLTEYCYGVASTVGLMAMHIVGFTSPEEAIPYAVKLGVALQLTNILRDVGEDWAMGRLYLPLEELEHFGLSVDDIAAGRVSDRWRTFMRFQIERVRRLYNEALPGIAYLHPDGRFAIAAAAELYQAITEDIITNHMDNLYHRAHLTHWAKLRRLPGIWWRANVVGYRA